MYHMPHGARMKYLFLDSEYYNSQEAKMNPICFSTILRIGGTNNNANIPKFFWTDTDPTPLKEYLQLHKDATFVCFAVAAESRALQALGIDPYQFKWLDLHILWKQLQNGLYANMYGSYYVKGKRYVSVAPPDGYEEKDEFEEAAKGFELVSQPQKLQGKHKRLETSLAATCAAVLDIDIDAEHKSEMVQIILRGHPYTDEERCKIKEYCESDTSLLPQLMPVMITQLKEVSDGNLKDIFKQQADFTRFGIDCGTISNNGIPVSLERLQRISRNRDAIKDALVRDTNKTFPFYGEFRKNRNADLMWVETVTAFKEYITKYKLENVWPKTDKGAYKKDEDTLNIFSHMPAIAKLQETKKILRQLGFLDAAKPDSIYSAIGKDGRLRPYFNCFGTQTGRNAPPAKRFIFAMSSWLRSCIVPPLNRQIVEIDYKSQEFIIAAIESEDSTMQEAYNSGDPYLFFGKSIGIIPEDGDKKSHEAERNTCKSLVLGLQYGLGVSKLADKLTKDSAAFVKEAKEINSQSKLQAKVFTTEDAQDLLTSHKQLFRKYWKWQYKIRAAHENHQPLSTKDGWMLFADRQNTLSAGNFPIQGAGATVLRRAIKYAIDAKLFVISPLHDAVYIETDLGDTADTAMLKVCMQQAFKDFYPDFTIGLDVSVHDTEHMWIPKKGEKMFKLLAKYYIEEEDLL